MKLRSFVILILALSMQLGCYQTSLAQSREASLAPSMKGYELYSWKVRGRWHFSLLVGTNRLKNRKEVTQSKVRLEGVEALKRKLNLLAKGEQLTWSTDLVPGTVLPPMEIIEAVRAYCNRRSIILRMG